MPGVQTRSNHINTSTPTFTLALWCVVCVTMVALRVYAEKPDPASSTYELFPIPQTKNSVCQDMVIDSSGIPWIAVNGKVSYWTGSEFREPMSGGLAPRCHLVGLYGGPDRGAYAAQKSGKEHEALLYKLDDGTVTLITTFYYDRSSPYLGLYVSSSGSVFSWGSHFLARYDGDKWDRIEARLTTKRNVVFDLGQEVYFYHNDALYRTDASGQIQARPCPPWTKPGPNQQSTSIVSVLWASTKALLFAHGRPGLFAFDLVTGKEIDLSEVNTSLRGVRFWDAFSAKNGDVWISGRRTYKGGDLFFRLSNDGQITEVPVAQILPLGQSRGRLPKAVLETRDGTIICGLPHDGLALIRDGQLSHWGWEYGFSEGIPYLHEDPDGNIWFPLKGKVARLRLADGPPVHDPISADWEEIILAHSGIWELHPGQVAMFRGDQPGMLSRWDGRKWSHQEVPFRTDSIEDTAVDDRGHLLLSLLDQAYGCFDVGSASVEKYPSMQVLLENAVTHGAMRFRTNFGLRGIVVTPDKRIWIRYQGAVHFFDSVRWDRLPFMNDVDYVLPSQQHGMLVRTQEGRFYRYDRGQMIEVPPSLEQARKLMIGEMYWQPYERGLIDAHPKEYFPVSRGERSPDPRDRLEFKLFFNPDEFEAYIAGENDDTQPAYVTLPPPSYASYRYRYTEKICAAASGGGWLWESGGPRSRLFAHGLFPIDTSGTPLAGKKIYDIKEDAAGDLWFLTSYSSVPRAYHHRLSQARLNVETPSPECGRELEVKVSVVPERMAQGTQLFTRVNNQRWIPMEDRQDRCMFRFPASGGYSCEMTGLRLGGRIRQCPSFHVRTDVPLPETILTASQQDLQLVDVLEWSAPVAVEKTTDTATGALLWRTDGGKWQRVGDDSMLRLKGFKPGVHTLEFCAEEEGFWRDPSPVHMKIEFSPDYEKIVTMYVLDLASDDDEVHEEAKMKLINLGKDHIPLVEKKLREAQEAAKLLPRLGRVIVEMREQN